MNVFYLKKETYDFIREALKPEEYEVLEDGIKIIVPIIISENNIFKFKV